MLPTPTPEAAAKVRAGSPTGSPTNRLTFRDLVEIDRQAAQEAPRPAFLAVYGTAEGATHRHCIYALLDPREPSRVLYVGQTTAHVLARLQGHVAEASRGPERHLWWSEKHDWIAGLLAAGVSPSIAVLEIIPEGGDLDEAEQRWIRFYAYRGEARLNRQVRSARTYGLPDSRHRSSR